MASAGFHVNKGEYISYAAALDAYIKKFSWVKFQLNGQIFAAGPKTWRMNVKPTDAREIMNKIAPHMNIYIHSSYTSNLWSDRKEVRHKTIELIRDELDIGRQMGARGVVIHFRDWSPDDLMPGLRMLGIPNDGPTLYLEIASKGRVPHCYSNPEWINSIFQQLKSLNVGLCIDTAHAWATGIDLSTEEKVRAYFEKINTQGKPILIHCNDNIEGLGERKDEHINISEGQIWETGNGYKEIFKLGYPIIFERGGNIEDDKDLYLYNDYYTKSIAN